MDCYNDLEAGMLAVAIVQQQVVVVQATRHHAARDSYVEVITFRHFANRTFVAESPACRISSRDLVAVFSRSDVAGARMYERGMLELPAEAFTEFVEISTINQRRMDKRWAQVPKRTTLMR